MVIWNSYGNVIPSPLRTKNKYISVYVAYRRVSNNWYGWRYFVRRQFERPNFVREPYTDSFKLKIYRNFALVMWSSLHLNTMYIIIFNVYYVYIKVYNVYVVLVYILRIRIICSTRLGIFLFYFILFLFFVFV